MRNQLVQRLSALDREIAETETELSILRYRLAEEQARLDEYRVRMLVAETPLADRDLHIAQAANTRIEREIARLESGLGELRTDRRRLSEQALAAT